MSMKSYKAIFFFLTFLMNIDCFPAQGMAQGNMDIPGQR